MVPVQGFSHIVMAPSDMEAAMGEAQLGLVWRPLLWAALTERTASEITMQLSSLRGTVTGREIYCPSNTDPLAK
jgi:hypothetical protein